MAIKKSPETGRKAAYVARNRAALIKSAQAIFAELGGAATIDEVAAHAEVAVSTVYKHFETKESLFARAIGEAMKDWEGWAIPIAQKSADPLEQLVLPIRFMNRIENTHPPYAKLIARNFFDVSVNEAMISASLASHIRQLIKAGVLSMDNSEIRIQNFISCVTGSVSRQLLDPKAKDSDGDTAIEIALTLLNISPAKAAKLAHGKLPPLFAKQNAK